MLAVVTTLAYPTMSGGKTNYFESFLHNSFFLIGQIIIAYWTVYFLFPRFFLKRKYFLFFASFIVSLILITLFQRMINLYVYYVYIFRLFDKTTEVTFNYWSFTFIVQTLLRMYPTAVIILCVKLVHHWYQSQQQLKETEKEQLRSELKFLQSQIHPHFFFNTLNNLYGLALSKSEAAPALILKLSDLMRYMLYEANVPSAPLTKEIHHIENYIEIEKIRYKEGFDIFFKKRGDLENFSIAPLLLLPFVENAFKHGFSESMRNAWISIDLEVDNNMLTFTVENSCAVVNDKPAGLGLKNVDRRLKLLYLDNYQLTIQNSDHHHLVHLNVPKLPV
ncbi:MAG TPA: histidine kinase [Chitinophagaceae bacterium]|nr:histidine kinase [Chitinophagaceae bacterium]